MARIKVDLLVDEELDDDLIVKFEELADTQEGRVGVEAQKRMMDFCGDDADKQHQLRVWIFVCREMAPATLVPSLIHGCARKEIVDLSKAAQKQRARHNPPMHSHRRTTKVN